MVKGVGRRLPQIAALLGRGGAPPGRRPPVAAPDSPADQRSPSATTASSAPRGAAPPADRPPAARASGRRGGPEVGAEPGRTGPCRGRRPPEAEPRAEPVSSRPADAGATAACRRPRRRPRPSPTSRRPPATTPDSAASDPAGTRPRQRRPTRTPRRPTDDRPPTPRRPETAVEPERRPPTPRRRRRRDRPGPGEGQAETASTRVGADRGPEPTAATVGAPTAEFPSRDGDPTPEPAPSGEEPAPGGWVARREAGVRGRPYDAGHGRRLRGRGARRPHHAQPSRGPQRGQRATSPTAMEAAIDQLEDDAEVWVGVLRANTAGQERPVFSAGADLKAINAARAASSAPSAVASPASSTASGASRSSSPSTAWPRRAAARSCSPSDLVVATTRSSFGLAEVKRNLVAGAGRAVPAATGDRSGRGDGGDPHRRADPGRAGLPARARQPPRRARGGRGGGHGAGGSRSPTPHRWRSGRAGKVVLAADYEDDETLKAMTDEAMVGVMALGGPEGGPHRLHREAGAGLEGPLGRGHDLVQAEEVEQPGHEVLDPVQLLRRQQVTLEELRR